MANRIVWCAIPVLNLDRAVKFYSAALGQEVKKHDFPGITVGVLPHNDDEVGLPASERGGEARRQRRDDLFECKRPIG